MRARNILTFIVLFLTLSLTARAEQKSEYGFRVIVLDAGHGGNDPGAVYGGVKEKDLTLKVVLRLGKKIEQGMPGVKVVYTRTTDKALASTKIEDLQRRADIANKAEGDLFLSVHVNAAKSTAAKGVESLIMGETPKEQQYNTDALFESNRDDLLDMSNEREAAIIRAYIQNLQFTYGEYSHTLARCIQQNYMQAGRHSRGVKRQPLRVLYATNMPGVLTEIGFLSNKEEASYLKSEKGQQAIVDALYRAVQDYSTHVLKTRVMEEPPMVQPEPQSEVKPEVKLEVNSEPQPEVKQEPAPQEPKLYDPRLYTGDTKQNATIETGADAPVKSAPAKSAPQMSQTKPQPKASTAVAPTVATDASSTYYTVQVLASKRVLALSSQEFKSYRNRVHQYESEGAYRYKYGVGKYGSRAEAVKAAEAVRKTFPQAFVVAVNPGKTAIQKK